ncbi:MAG: hypothetical protein AB1405_09430, partial [Bdellovibrionota bacterium]
MTPRLQFHQLKGVFCPKSSSLGRLVFLAKVLPLLFLACGCGAKINIQASLPGPLVVEKMPVEAVAIIPPDLATKVYLGRDMGFGIFPIVTWEIPIGEEIARSTPKILEQFFPSISVVEKFPQGGAANSLFVEPKLSEFRVDMSRFSTAVTLSYLISTNERIQVYKAGAMCF